MCVFRGFAYIIFISCILTQTVLARSCFVDCWVCEHNGLTPMKNTKLNHFAQSHFTRLSWGCPNPHHTKSRPIPFHQNALQETYVPFWIFSLCFFFCLWFSNPKLAKTARIWKSARKLFFLPENPFRLEFWLRLKLQPAWDPRYTYVCIFIRVYQYTHIYVSTCVYILFHDMYLYIIIYIYIFTVYYIIIIYTYICTHQLTTTVSASSTTWSQVLELKEDWAKVHSRCVCARSLAKLM